MIPGNWPTWLLSGLLLAGCGVARQDPPPSAAGQATPTGADATLRTAPRATSSPDAQEAENSIYFRANDEIPAPEELAKLRRHAERLKGDTKLMVTLVGHTDDQGSRSYKLAVADKRVRVVFYQLLREGVPRKQLRRYPAGKEKTDSACDQAECRESMRRVELVWSRHTDNAASNVSVHRGSALPSGRSESLPATFAPDDSNSSNRKGGDAVQASDSKRDWPSGEAADHTR
mgnify:CR=1 FL=1